MTALDAPPTTTGSSIRSGWQRDSSSGIAHCPTTTTTVQASRTSFSTTRMRLVVTSRCTSATRQRLASTTTRLMFRMRQPSRTCREPETPARPTGTATSGCTTGSGSATHSAPTAQAKSTTTTTHLAVHRARSARSSLIAHVPQGRQRVGKTMRVASSVGARLTARGPSTRVRFTTPTWLPADQLDPGACPPPSRTRSRARTATGGARTSRMSKRFRVPLALMPCRHLSCRSTPLMDGCAARSGGPSQPKCARALIVHKSSRVVFSQGLAPLASNSAPQSRQNTSLRVVQAALGASRLQQTTVLTPHSGTVQVKTSRRSSCSLLRVACSRCRTCSAPNMSAWAGFGRVLGGLLQTRSARKPVVSRTSLGGVLHGRDRITCR